MANTPVLMGTAAMTALSLVGTYFALRSNNKSEKAENAGEIINNIKLVMPDDDKNTHFLALMYIAVGVFVIYLLVKMFKRCNYCKNANKQQIDSFDLDNPRMV